MTVPTIIRVLQDPPLDGPQNMARDETLMTHVGTGQSPPTLRLYQWYPPTISLGYFQHYADYEAVPPPAGSLPVVRRLTGGGAILHDLELTYSMALPVGHPLVAVDPNKLYELAHDAIIACLSSLGITSDRGGPTDDSGPARGPFFCFERRHSYDVLIGQGKVAGSAQRRTRHAILQHGSIILGNRYAQQTTASLTIGFEDLIKRVRASLPEQVAEVTGETLETGNWSSHELASATKLVTKYTGDEWKRRA